MTITPRIILNNLSFHLPQTPVHFDKINLCFEPLKYGIVGHNGVGKTTFLNLLTGELVADSGDIICFGKIIDSPQSHQDIANDATIMDVLGISTILQALMRIHQGSIAEDDFEIVRDDWNIEKRIEDTLSLFKLWPIDLKQSFQQLSGGQKTKLLLAKTLLFPTDFIIFDEPTNNLDTNGRDILYHYVANTAKGIIIVSHDRKLLNQCDKIVEITTKSIAIYGGNYDFYQEQKNIKQLAIEQEIQARSEILIKSKQAIQNRMEQHQKNESRGRKEKIRQIKSLGHYNKIELKAKKGKSENTNRRIRLQADRKLALVNTELVTARSKLEVQEELKVNLEKTNVPNNKIIMQLENLCFAYGNNNLINDFNLTITGPERVAITGPNGCGKSTLIQLIRGLLVPCSGKIIVGTMNIAYLDQSLRFLNPELSIVANFLQLNPEQQPFAAYSALASFKFRNKDAEKIVGQLSGGEKIRAALAICLMAANAPQLIILDEPTNHLDLATVEAIEEALNLYQGAILAVSHDENFLKNINIKKNVGWISGCEAAT